MMMSKNDLLLSVAATYLIAIFLLPTLLNTDVFSKIPFQYAAVFLIFPVLVVIGMAFASFVGKKIGFLWQVAKFGLVGVLNTAIDFGILNFLISITGITAGRGIIAMNTLSFSIAVINSYFWNKEWVFPGRKKSNFMLFLIVSFIGIGINSGVVYTLTTFVPPVIVSSDTLWANLAKVLATGLSLIWNFLGYKLLVFKESARADVKSAPAQVPASK